jgi:hypothetical protein
MDRVPAFLDALSASLVPECDREVVRAAFASAATACGGPRGRDGRRASALTPSGVPFEASVTGGAGRSAAVLRYATEPGAGLPFFGPRLAAQRRAVADLAARLAPGARAGGEEVRALYDVLFPEPGAVPARTRFASFVGVVHTPGHPGHLAGLKVYGNLRAADPPDAVAGLRRRWPGFGLLDDLTCDLAESAGPLSAQFVALEAEREGLRSKLYLRTRTPGPQGFAALAQRVGADLGPLDDALADAGLAPGRWDRPVFACLATRADGGGAVALSVHVAARSADLGPAAMAGVAGRLAGRHGDGEGVAALIRAMAAAGPGGGFEVTVVGVGLAPGGGVGKVNVYAAPTAAPDPGRTGARPYSNSGWIGSRVGA